MLGAALGRLRIALRPARLLLLLAASATLLRATCAGEMGEQCDWTGSGLSTGPGRGVTPVYLRCSAGQLSWSFPRGALRVLLRVGATGRDFRGCVRARGRGARLFLEGPRSLVPLPLQGQPGLVRCFHSRSGQAALYVEASELGSPGGHPKEEFGLEYDLEPLPRGARYDDSQECRPCTPQEMARAYCTSDLVARGYIRTVENDDDLEETRLVVKTTRLLRRLSPDSRAGGFESGELADSNSLTENQLDVDDGTWVNGDETATLHVPRHCGAKHGAGEFVFMARRKLGQLSLTCAPRLEDWVHILSDVNRDGSAHCVLRS